ncbi:MULTISPECIES: protocatechuate 3,4-dioxygenase [unclassified Ruegeria]|uniref:dioxygenase family protein n=1 Tax=unclassified Ruegeria TaxID=2625375 RepID=UPI0014891ABF|nr:MULTISPECIES: protocatechuate 3,4-dioxygenase [unclassified Ruegeria]NOD78867.1 protocatechuate 3,4-dioxygenase [Ruegeria sp. HKCCD4332]NOD91060.1 protocatechuate 3,4-dioxygenase [Ruegeria sp. HKCCD4318]NOE16257.1 protocatechuate 3,4-dioxygenase [Ruegeria sp. HKCCD4318-2]NOG07456.1 protocatechuate 3,4-dioxygenase [Ruegeria sp. HKCCD4315]
MKQNTKSRRKLLGGIVGLMGVGSIGARAAAAVLTPSAAEGPYYPTPAMRTPDTDNDLVKIRGRVEDAGGEVFTLRGKLMRTNGQPLARHRIEIWQCDMDGNYMHPRDRRSVNFDQAFQGFGHDVTDNGGNYVFRTIKPTIYPGRTPHIHVKVFDGSRELLTTQFYIKGHPNNSRDGLFNRMSRAEAAAVSMEFSLGATGTEATINVVV